jgi:hypothetical protein
VVAVAKDPRPLTHANTTVAGGAVDGYYTNAGGGVTYWGNSNPTNTLAKEAKLAWAGKTAIVFLVKVPAKGATSILMAEMARGTGDPPTKVGRHFWDATVDNAVDEAVGKAGEKLLELPGVKTAFKKNGCCGLL